MTAAWVYLLLAAWGATGTFIAVSRGRRPPSLGALYFILAFPVAELPLHHVALSAVVTALFAALGAFDSWPGWAGLVLVIASWAALLVMHGRSLKAQAAIDHGLQETLGAHFFEAIRPEFADRLKAGAPLSAWINPFRLHDRARVVRVRNLAYGPAGRRNRLDVYHPRESGQGRPVLLQIHGGAWIFGRKDDQGLPLMDEMARQGWVCVAPNYRLSPRATFPDHLVDCKLAIRWIRENIASYGGDPDFIAVPAGLTFPLTANLVRMRGSEVFKFAVRAIPETTERALAASGLTSDDVTWLVPHQANQRILDTVADRLGIPQERVVSHIEWVGNTSSASIPLAVHDLYTSGNLRPGDVLALVGFGAGLTWGAAIVRWTKGPVR